MIVFLVGFMGCGKSTIGRRLASRIGYDFLDLDRAVEQRAGMTVAEIFSRYGEEAFREMEREELLLVGKAQRLVVATGGGAPCYLDNMDRMRQAGLTVYFRMSPARLVTRLARGRERRPKISGMDDMQLQAYVQDALRVREPVYQQASLVIDCDGVGDDYIASHIVRYLQYVPASAGAGNPQS